MTVGINATSSAYYSVQIRSGTLRIFTALLTFTLSQSRLTIDRPTWHCGTYDKLYNQMAR